MISREAWYREASELLTLYHVTPLRNVRKIMQNGLVPQVGPRAKELGEEEPAVYLFRTREDAADGVDHWLGDQFPDGEPLALLEVKVEPSGVKRDDPSVFEVEVGVIIDPRNIRVVTERF